MSSVIDRALPLVQYQLEYDMNHALKEHEVKHCDQIKRPRLGSGNGRKSAWHQIRCANALLFNFDKRPPAFPPSIIIVVSLYPRASLCGFTEFKLMECNTENNWHLFIGSDSET